MFTIYSADVTGNPGNCSYPHKHVILDEASLKSAISHDYVCAEYRNSYRNGENFIGSDCLPVDCDNDYSENPSDEEFINGNDDIYNSDDVFDDTYDEDYSDFEEAEEKKGKSLFVPVLSAVTVVVIMVAVFFIATLVKNMFTDDKTGTSEFAMPNLVGMDYNQAVEAYPKLDIQVDSTEWSELEKDKIFYQSVPEGDGVKKGEIIKVKVSLGAKTIKVPNVINYHFKTAEEALRAEGLEVEFKYQENKDVEEEIVFDTEPAALSEVAPGTTILVYVSKGKDVEEIEMETLSGK